MVFRCTPVVAARPGDDRVKSGEKGGEKGILFRVLPRSSAGENRLSAVPACGATSDAAEGPQG